MENAPLEAENFVCHANTSKIQLTYYTLHHSHQGKYEKQISS